MKKISIVVLCYNEEKSVHTMHRIITELYTKKTTFHNRGWFFVLLIVLPKKVDMTISSH